MRLTRSPSGRRRPRRRARVVVGASAWTRSRSACGGRTRKPGKDRPARRRDILRLSLRCYLGLLDGLDFDPALR